MWWLRQRSFIGIFLDVIFTISAVSLLVTACETAPIQRFSKIHNDMTKDEVLDLVGNPTWTDHHNGVEKWGYTFYAASNHDEEHLMQVSFIEGKVVSYGEDQDEIQRLQDVKKMDERAYHNTNPEKNSKPSKPAQFIEMTGHDGPTDN